MADASFRFSDRPRSDAVLPAYVRASGAIRCRFAAMPRGTEAIEVSERGGYRVKFPKGESCEAVLINTGGGMAGGDHLAIDITLDVGARATVTSQSAEKIYRAQTEPSRVKTRLALAAGAHLAWLPQETLLFNGARLERSLAIEMDDRAELTLFESVVFGRTAMGEVMVGGRFLDRWRIRRGGKLVFADSVKLDGPVVDILARPALGGGARSVATFLYIAPDAETRLDAAREALALSLCETGASAWNGMLVTRFAADDPSALRLSVARFLSAFRGKALPRVWQC